MKHGANSTATAYAGNNDCPAARTVLTGAANASFNTVRSVAVRMHLLVAELIGAIVKLGGRFPDKVVYWRD